MFEDTAAPEADPEAGVNNTRWLALVEAEVTFIFVAVVAVPIVKVAGLVYAGVFAVPAETRIKPLVPGDNLSQVDDVFANNKSPTVNVV